MGPCSAGGWMHLEDAEEGSREPIERSPTHSAKPNVKYAMLCSVAVLMSVWRIRSARARDLPAQCFKLRVFCGAKIRLDLA